MWLAEKDGINYYILHTFKEYVIVCPLWRPDTGYNHTFWHDMTIVVRFDDRTDCDTFIAETF